MTIWAGLISPSAVLVLLRGAAATLIFSPLPIPQENRLNHYGSSYLRNAAWGPEVKRKDAVASAMTKEALVMPTRVFSLWPLPVNDTT